MNPGILDRLEDLSEREEAIHARLADPEVLRDRDRYRALTMELADIAPVVSLYREFRDLNAKLEQAREILDDDDRELRELARQELPVLEGRIEGAEHSLKQLLLPRDRNDRRDIYLEIRAGTGGNEAALFAGDLFRMYSIYAERMGWSVEVVAKSDGEAGGYKEIVSRVEGRGAYSKLKFESGVHRVQRVPETESQGRIHTSACTVAVLPVADDVDEIEVGAGDLRVDTFRASGAGGQHVNKTDSAVRLTHLPTGIVVECQDERSQHKNRARAMSILKSRLLEAEIARQRAEEAQTRRDLVGSGDRSERIRTYNFPQNRVTDHRINLTLYRLDEIVCGALGPLVEALAAEHQADRLAALSAVRAGL